MEEPEKVCSCIECGKSFKPYKNNICCHICGGEGYLEDEDDFMRSGSKNCWQCNGRGELTITEQSFCDDDCREDYFEKQFGTD